MKFKMINTLNNNGYLQSLCIGLISKSGNSNCLHIGFCF